MKRTNTILLLESDPVIAREIDIKLRNFGYYIFEHTSKKSHLFSLIVKEKPDLILMELRQGEELADVEMAQVILENYHIPVVFLTSAAGKSLVEKSKRPSAQYFILKPLIEKDLLFTIELTLFRHNMERRLYESEKKYDELSDSIFQTVLECDLEGRILWINRHGMEMLGVTAAEVEKGIVLSDYVQKNASGSILDVSRKSSFIDSAILNREFVLLNKLGKKYAIEELLSPVYKDYKLSGFRGILIDITNRKLKHNLCCIFANVNQQYDCAEADLKKAFQYIKSELQEFFPGVQIKYLESGQLPYEVEVCFEGYPEILLKTHIPMVLRGKELELFNKKQKLNNPVHQQACWMSFPLGIKKEPEGIFVFSSTTNLNIFSKKDFELLVDFFDDVNLFLEKINSLKELKRNKNLFKSFVNTINEGLIRIDLDCNITFANNRLTELSGYEQEDILGKKCWEFISPDEHQKISKVLEERRRGKSSQHELHIKIKSGEYRKFYINGAPYRDENGVIVGSIGTFTDVTNRQEQQAFFNATETLLREITSTVDVAFWVYCLETKKIQYLSPAFKSIFEEELETIYRTNTLRNFIHPGDLKAVLERYRANLNTAECEVKYRILTPKGNLKWIKDRSVLIKNSNGKVIKIIGYAQEITKIKSTEEKLAKSEIEKENIIRSIPDSFVILDNANIVLNSYFKEAELRLSLNKGKHIAGKKINKVVNEKLAGLITEKIEALKQSGQAQVFEVNEMLKGQPYWYEIRMTSTMEDAVMIIIRNISSEKMNLNKIQKFFNITEQTKELILITDANGKVEYVNPAFSTVTGYEPVEIIGRSTSILRSGKHSKTFYSGLWRTLNAGKPFKGDFYNHKKSGELFIEEKIITPYVDSKGEITNFISTGRDVTHERKNTLKINRHSHLERNLALKQQKNRTLSLIQGHENERRKFALDIHEGLNQMLLVAMMNLEQISENELINPEQKVKIESVNAMVGEIMKELRGISSNLSPVSLFGFGLYAVVQQMISRLNLTQKITHVYFKSNIEGLRFKEEIEINLYRIIQETLQNALKHSKAEKIYVTLNFNRNKLIFLIKDNGIGLSLEELKIKKRKGHGIYSVEERAAVIGAQLEITTLKDKGFEMNMTIKTSPINL